MCPSTVRESARAVLLNRDERLLLFQFSFPGITQPGSPDDGPLWVTVGGAVEPGESDQQTLRREIWEETGIDSFDVGPLVWVREIELVEHGTPLTSRERYYLVRLSDNPQITLANFSQWEQDNCHGYRWFSVDELVSERLSFRPPQMGLYLRELLDGRVPTEPLRIE